MRSPPAVRPTVRRSRTATVLSIALVIGVAGALMFFVSTFLRFFWGGNRVGPDPGTLEIGVVGATLVTAAYVWRTWSPAAALAWTRIVTIVAWAVAVLVQWYASFGGA